MTRRLFLSAFNYGMCLVCLAWAWHFIQKGDFWMILFFLAVAPFNFVVATLLFRQARQRGELAPDNTVRIVLELRDEDASRKLHTLRRLTETTGNAELFRRALNTYATLNAEVADGNEVLIRTPDGEEREVNL